MRDNSGAELVPSAKFAKRDPKQGGQTGDKRIGRMLRGIVVRQRRKAECVQKWGRGTCVQREIGKLLLVILIRVTPPIFASIPLGNHAYLLIDGKNRFNEVLDAENRTILDQDSSQLLAPHFYGNCLQ